MKPPKLTPAGERIVDAAVKYGHGLHLGNASDTLAFACVVHDELRDAARPLSLSQIDDLICLVRGDEPDDVDGGPWELSDAGYELVLTLRALRAELNKEDADAGA